MAFEAGDSGEDDIGAYLQGMQYFIDSHMDDDPDMVQWYYSEAGLRDDVVAGQMDITTLTPDHEYRLSVVAWLGIDAFEAGAAAYGVRDMDDGPLIAWQNGVERADQLQYFDHETAVPVDDHVTREQLAALVHLLRYGAAAEDALAVPDDSIHQKPSRTRWIVAILEAFAAMQALPPDVIRDDP